MFFAFTMVCGEGRIALFWTALCTHCFFVVVFSPGPQNLRRPRDWNVADLVHLRKRPRLEEEDEEEED